MIDILDTLNQLAMAHRERAMIARIKASRIPDDIMPLQKREIINSAIANEIAVNAIESAIANISATLDL